MIRGILQEAPTSREDRKWSVQGRNYIESPTGEYMSLPDLDRGENAGPVIGDRYGTSEGTLCIMRGEIYLDGGRYDKTFKNTEELVQWLNEKGFEYLGIDDIY